MVAVDDPYLSSRKYVDTTTLVCSSIEWNSLARSMLQQLIVYLKTKAMIIKRIIQSFSLLIAFQLLMITVFHNWICQITFFKYLWWPFSKLYGVFNRHLLTCYTILVKNSSSYYHTIVLSYLLVILTHSASLHKTWMTLLTVFLWPLAAVTVSKYFFWKLKINLAEHICSYIFNVKNLS
jgi:hypothetical protein